MDYMLYRLSVNEIKNYCAVKANGSYEPVKVDLNNRFVFDSVVLSRDEMTENAFIYQALKAAAVDTATGDEEALLKQIIIMDFSYSLNSDEAKGFDKFVLDNGIDLIFQDNIQRHFVAMDKSGSMSKENKILYVSDELAENLFERLMLGMTENEAKAYNIQTNASKLYAYRGLYLTDSVRIMTEVSKEPQKSEDIENEDIIKLNTETVLILDDESGVDVDWQPNEKYHFLSEKSDYITAESNGNKDENDKLIWKLQVKEGKTLSLSPFDGEGLICPEYAEIINKQMKIPMRNVRSHTDKDSIEYQLGATSFQIRMPFCKGMLHTLSWKKLIMDQIDEMKSDIKDEMKSDIKYEDLYIKDIYGCWRKLDKTKIILTRSMFKCNKWWGLYCKLKSTSKGDASKSTNDWVGYYFSKMKEYDHSLYISQTNYVFPNIGKTSINYQFLNPLCISKDEFDLLLNEQERLICALQDDPLNSLISIYASDNEEDVENEGDAPKEQKTQTKETKKLVLSALLADISFVKDPYIRNKISDCQLQLIKDIYKGRFSVDGQLRYLSGDLLAFIAIIVDRCRIGLESNEEPKDEKIRSFTTYILENRLTHDKETEIDQFYMPQSKIIKPAQDEYALLRNPHLSRYEESLVNKIKGKKLNFYKKYFDHLDGIIMLGCRSIVPSVIGGADFDGDLVRLISEQCVVDAVKKGLKKCDEQKKRIPFVQIPNPMKAQSKLEISIQQKISARIDSDIIIRTFSNRIGHISNMAVRFGEVEYDSEVEYDRSIDKKDKVLRIKDKSEGPVPVDYDESLSAEGCILVGLEIDANKNGFHPSLEEYEKAGKVFEDYRKDKQKTDYIKTKEKLDKYRFREIEFYKKEDQFIVCNPDGGRKFVVYKPENKTGISQLPWECLNTYNQVRRPFGNNNSRWFMVNQELYHSAKEAKLFWFEVQELYYSDEIKDKLVQILSAYNKVTSEAGKRYRALQAAKDARYFSRIRVILTLQYGDLAKPFYMDESRTVEMVALDAYNQLNYYLEPSREIRESFMKEIVNDWMFLPEDKRRELLTEITVDESVVELLSNFSNRGFYLLYYLTKHIYFSYRKQDVIDESWEILSGASSDEKTEDIISDPQNRYLTQYQKIFYRSFIKKDDEYKWKRVLIRKCRNDIKSLFREGSFLKYESEQNEKLSTEDKKIDAAIACLHLMRNAETPIDKGGRFFWKIFRWEEIQRNLFVAKETINAQ